MYEVRVKPGKDSVPLAGGLFNRCQATAPLVDTTGRPPLVLPRTVYLEGLKRRSENLKPHLGRGHTTASICNVS
jgi:hypothetical protein